MIKLLAPFNYKGGIIAAGTTIGLGDLEAKLIAGGAAEEFNPVKEPAKPDPEPTLEETLEPMTKAELLEYIKQAGIEDITDKNKKEEIIAALLNAVDNGFELKLDTGE